MMNCDTIMNCPPPAEVAPKETEVDNKNLKS